MKLFKTRDRAPEISREQALRLKPVKNKLVEETRLESGVILLSYPVGQRPWIASLIKRFSGASEKPIVKKLELDLLGSSVWALVDGKRSVKQIAREFSQKHNLHAKEAEVSVTQFIRQLGQRGLLGLT